MASEGSLGSILSESEYASSSVILCECTKYYVSMRDNNKFRNNMHIGRGRERVKERERERERERKRERERE